MTGATFRSAALFALLTAAGLSLGACANAPGVRIFGEHQVDPRSPVAKEVADAARQPTKFPTFADVPPTPKDVRDAAAFKSAVNAENQAGQTLTAEGATATFGLNDTEAFAARARAAATPPPPIDQESTEAFAQSQRERATPPPSPTR